MEKIFVFGSNLAGRHGAGAALFAKDRRGANYCQGEGLQGQSYAIPIKDGRNRSIPMTHPSQVLPLEQIEEGVQRFIRFTNSRPDLQFELTPVGCGKAGFRPDQIAPFFRDAPPSCPLPIEFLQALDLLARSEASDPEP
jgi:hypothetical protein